MSTDNVPQISQEKARLAKLNFWTKIGQGPNGILWLEVQWNGTRLSITGVEGPRRNGDCRGSCGQCREALLEVTDPAEGYTLGTIRQLYAIWNAWHLNDLRAGCSHQQAFGWKSYDEHPSEPCPICGYKFGSAWNTEIVPAGVIKFLAGLPKQEGPQGWR